LLGFSNDSEYGDEKVFFSERTIEKFPL
jgi:hypothetical protein